ncbi:MAG: sulfatase [bacterium]|nr:sulfatase [bacterium]
MRRSRVGWCGNVLVALGVLISGQGCDRSAESADRRQPNVLMIVVDTLRADKLGCYGSPLGLTPQIDAFAAGGTRFETTYAHAPWTLPSFASLLTSTYPVEHGAGGQVGRWRPLRGSARTLAECFRDAGYATGAVVNVDFLTQPFGMNQGYAAADYDFHAPSDNVNMRDATATTSAALGWLGRRDDRPFFMMVHYFDPHVVYAPPATFRRKFASPEDREGSNWVFGTRGDMMGLRRGTRRLEPEIIRRVEKLYDGEVAYADQQIGRLLAELNKLGLADSTIVMITADHGEEFLDHGGFEHGHTLYDELLRVPLIMCYPPRLPRGTVVAPVGQIDVAPTLCALAGIDPEPSFAGRSLLPLVDGGAWEDRPILAMGNFWGPPLSGLRMGDHKIVRMPNGISLYRVSSDPRELTDLASSVPVRESLEAKLAQVIAAAAARGAGAGAGSTVILSPEELERLGSLGYLETGEAGSSGVPATQPVRPPG